jgi:hypothetical protein
MPQTPAQPTVALATRVPIEVDARRRRLQEQTGKTVPELIDQAFLLLECSLNRATGNRSAGTDLQPQPNASESLPERASIDAISGGTAV